MEPLAPTALRGPVPIPPQRANKTANSVGSGVNPPKSTSALPPNLNNSTLTNQTNTSKVRIHYVYGSYFENKALNIYVSVLILSLCLPN